MDQPTQGRASTSDRRERSSSADRLSVFGLLILPLLCAVGAHQAFAQRVIGDSIRCPSCRIDVSPVARIGTENGPGALTGEPFTVAVDSHGRFWVVQTGTPPMVYDSTGRFLKEIGGRGDGPGEYRWPILAAVIADSVIVYDQMRAILNVVGPDLEFVRDVTLAHVGQFNALDAVRWPVVLVEKKGRSPPDGSQIVLQTVDMRGRAAIPTDSFVIERRLGPSALRSALPLGFAIGPSNTVWTWEPTEYRLDAWSLDGHAQDLVRREASWFPALREDRAGTFRQPGPSSRPVSCGTPRRLRK